MGGGRGGGADEELVLPWRLPGERVVVGILVFAILMRGYH